MTNKNSVAAAEWNKRIIPEDERNTKARIAELEADVKVWQESVERLREKIEAMRSVADEGERKAYEAGRVCPHTGEYTNLTSYEEWRKQNEIL